MRCYHWSGATSLENVRLGQNYLPATNSLSYYVCYYDELSFFLRNNLSFWFQESRNYLWKMWCRLWTGKRLNSAVRCRKTFFALILTSRLNKLVRLRPLKNYYMLDRLGWLLTYTRWDGRRFDSLKHDSLFTLKYESKTGKVL